MKWYGIYDTCCEIEGNIRLIGFNSDMGQCQLCKRVFTK